MLKMVAIWLCNQWKMLQCWQRTGICPLFSSPPRGIWQLKSPHPREFAIQGKKNANPPGVSRGGWAQVELTDFFGCRLWMKGRFQKSQQAGRTMTGPCSFENELRSFQEFFAEKLSPCILFIIWLIWLDSFDKKSDSFWLVRSEKWETPQAIDWVLQDVQKLKQSKY